MFPLFQVSGFMILIVKHVDSCCLILEEQFCKRVRTRNVTKTKITLEEIQG